MHIILFHGTTGKSGSVTLGRGSLAAIALTGLLALPLATGYLGYRLGHPAAEGGNGLAIPDSWKQELLSQREEIEGLRLGSEARTEVLALRLAQLQAQMVRLDALGERLTEQAGLDKGEFDFSAPPPQGGPEVAVDLAPARIGDLEQALDELARQMEDRERQLDLLSDLITDQNVAAETLPAGRPVLGGYLSSGYGKRTDPFTGKQDWHPGVDFAGKAGSEIIAVAKGVVTFVGTQSGYGNVVEINHGNGITTRYGHNKKNLAKVGQVVKQGDVIALMGSTGRSTGPHVHFEVLRDGRAVNPKRYLAAGS